MGQKSGDEPQDKTRGGELAGEGNQQHPTELQDLPRMEKVGSIHPTLQPSPSSTGLPVDREASLGGFRAGEGSPLAGNACPNLSRRIRVRYVFARQFLRIPTSPPLLSHRRLGLVHPQLDFVVRQDQDPPLIQDPCHAQPLQFPIRNQRGNGATIRGARAICVPLAGKGDTSASGVAFGTGADRIECLTRESRTSPMVSRSHGRIAGRRRACSVWRPMNKGGRRKNIRTRSLLLLASSNVPRIHRGCRSTSNCVRH